MSTESEDVHSVIARHERQIAELRDQVTALHEGYVKEQLQAEITQKIAALEADIKLQKLQETMAKEEAEKVRKRGFFRRK